MKLNKSIYLLLLIPIGISATSCNKKGCTNSYAENYEEKAKKDDGSCTYARTKFLGTYNVNQNCVYGGSDSFTMSISEGPVENEVLISNFGNFGQTIRATVNGTLLTFNDEKAGVVFEGDGYIVGNTVNIDYEACESFYYPCSDPEICSMTATK